MIAVIDTNVLISGIRTSNSPPSIIVDRWFVREFDLAMSDTTYAEFLEILGRDYWVTTLEDYTENLVQLVEHIANLAVFKIEIPEIPEFTPDPKDIKFFAIALAANADYIVTGDKVMRRDNPYADIFVITPREFLDILEARSKEDAPQPQEPAGETYPVTTASTYPPHTRHDPSHSPP